MSSRIKIILFTFIGIATIGLITYGVLSSKKLDQHKEKKVKSNINDFLYDETKDTIDTEDEEEDLDGDEVVDEDDDFEEYNEADGEWEDETPVEKEKKTIAKKKTPETTIPDDDELEPLYDNTKEDEEKTPDPKPKKSETEKPSSSGYLVIVGSFKSKTNAGKKLSKLKKAGIEGEIIRLKGSKLYTVVARRFETESQAESFAQDLDDKHKIRAIVKEQ